MTFFLISLPVLVYLVLTLFGNLLEFIQLLHIEDQEDETALLTDR